MNSRDASARTGYERYGLAIEVGASTGDVCPPSDETYLVKMLRIAGLATLALLAVLQASARATTALETFQKLRPFAEGSELPDLRQARALVARL